MKFEPRQLQISFLSTVTVVLFCISVLYSFVTVVPWGKYRFYLSATVLCSITTVLVVLGTVLRFRRRQYVSGAFHLLMLVASAVFMFANGASYRDLYGARVELAGGADFPAICAAARSALELAAHESQPELLSVRHWGSFQYSFRAKGTQDSTWYGSGGRKGSDVEWTVKRMKVSSDTCPPNSIENAYSEFVLQDPSISTNRRLSITWKPDSGRWDVTKGF